MVYRLRWSLPLDFYEDPPPKCITVDEDPDFFFGNHPDDNLPPETEDEPEEVKKLREENREMNMRLASYICNGSDGRPVCPKRSPCLLFALYNNEQHGVWGGLTPQERSHIRKTVPPEEWTSWFQ